MNRDDIIRIALEAGFERNSLGWSFTYGRLDYHLERFAALVIQHKALDQLTAASQYEQGFEDGAKAEREQCAKVCDLIAINACDNRAHECGVAIRARGQQ